MPFRLLLYGQRSRLRFLDQRPPRNILMYRTAGEQRVIHPLSRRFCTGKIHILRRKASGKLFCHGYGIPGQVQTCDRRLGMQHGQKTSQNPIAAANVKNIPCPITLILQQIIHDPSKEHIIIKRSSQNAHLYALIQVIHKLLLTVEIRHIFAPIHQPLF